MKMTYLLSMLLHFRIRYRSNNEFIYWLSEDMSRRMCRQESDGDGGTGEKKDRKTKAEVVG